MALILFLLLIAFSEWRIARAGRYAIDDLEQLPHNHVGLVLGTSRYLVGGGANPYFDARIAAAAELYRHDKIDYLLVSGDNATKQYNEPRAMRRALIKAGVPAEVIYSDYAGFRTFDSVVRAQEVFGQQRYTIISQRFQNERAIYIARQWGIEAIGYNAADVEDNPWLWLRERLARLLSLIDIHLLNREPKFLGEPIIIGKSQRCLAINTIGTRQPCLRSE